MREHMLKQLAKLAIVYQSSHSPEELALLAGIFAETFADEESATIERAFAMHMRNCKRFPTPAHIAELLPGCRPRPAHIRLRESAGEITPGYGRRLFLEWKVKRERAQAGEVKQ